MKTKWKVTRIEKYQGYFPVVHIELCDWKETIMSGVWLFTSFSRENVKYWLKWNPLTIFIIAFWFMVRIAGAILYYMCLPFVLLANRLLQL